MAADRPLSVPTRLVVARVGRAHGIRGEVSVRVRTDSPRERFVPGGVLFTDERPHPRTLTISSVRDHNGALLICFQEIVDRNDAEALRGVHLEADVEVESDREDDAWFDHELIGLHARAPDGAVLGEVVAVEHLPAQDLLEVRRDDGERRLVPLVSALVPTVDVAGGFVVIDDPGGLLD